MFAHSRRGRRLNHDAHSKAREFSLGTKIYYGQNFGAGSQWLSGEVLEKKGPLSYLVKLSDGRLFRRITCGSYTNTDNRR